MPIVAGKQVTYREKLPGGKWWSILPRLALMEQANALEVLDWDMVVAIIQGTVESWEFDGSPDSAEDIAELDTFTELLPLVRAISAEINERTAGLGEAT